jgi:HK97 family phage major capsid protein
MASIDKLNPRIAAIESRNTLATMVRDRGPEIILGGGSTTETPGRVSTPENHPKAAEFRNNFAAWMNNALSSIDGSRPAMEATAPTGPVSIGTTSGWDSIGITVPTEILPYLPSYYNLDSFGLAGATQIFTDHTRPLVKPILSAGAADATFTENQAPSTSQPFGLSSFTFGGTKYARLVLASYESLMNSELPLQGAIMDELLASLATTLTTAVTTSFVTALAGASSSLAVGVGGSSGSVYTSMVDLRHAVPPRFDMPTNKWMLSRATLAEIRNTKASTSGVPLFSPDGTKLFDREYVINDNLDTTSGAGVGFVAFGSFADGVWIRRTPIQTRVFYELYAQSGQLGFRTQQWNDAHFLAELAGAAQPPTFQPLYYTNVVSES